jgi:MerR family transcriptional regulator, light-induced transcriptional regulator
MKTLLYPIRAVSKLTGISIDTLRAWERRYQVVTPQRDERGRVYTEADVQHLRLLNAAVESGHAIGQVATLSDKELQALIARPHAVTNDTRALKSRQSEEPGGALRAVFTAIERLDYAEAERELALLATVLPPRELVHRVVLPLMKEVGDAWHRGELGIAHEHMTSALVRNLLGALIPLHRRTSPAGKLLFATPSGEQHEFGILIAAMLAVGGGMGIVYLGSNLPAEEVLSAAQKTAPQAVVLGFIGANGARAGLVEIERIAHKLPSQIEFWIGGAKDEALRKEIGKTRALLIEDFTMLEQHLSRLGARF